MQRNINIPEGFIELKLLHPIQCSIVCLNDPVVIKEAEKELSRHAWWAYKQRQEQEVLPERMTHEADDE